MDLQVSISAVRGGAEIESSESKGHKDGEREGDRREESRSLRCMSHLRHVMMSFGRGGSSHVLFPTPTRWSLLVIRATKRYSQMLFS